MNAIAQAVDPRERQVQFVLGKGGVGRSAVAAALARRDHDVTRDARPHSRVGTPPRACAPFF